MRNLLYAVLFFTFISFNSSIWAVDTEVPLPADALKTMEKSANIGPSVSTIESYETSFTQERIYAFYKKEMARAGWSEARKGFFKKGNYMAMVVVSPAKTRTNKTEFSVTTSRIPTKEEILAQRKSTPDRLNFMPVYPKSEQVFLWDTPTGISASYETKSAIKDVVFFYKSAMLNYGWSLSNETPIAGAAVDCPECQKALAQLPKGTAKANIPAASSKASLNFRKESGESCIIRLYEKGDGSIFQPNVSGKIESPSIPAENKTTILVTYNANKRINL